MAGRRKIYTTGSSFRYKAKMYDYMSRGGRVPMTLAMEVVDAMTSAWDENFGKYRGFRKDVVVKEMDKLGVPAIFRGAVQALAMKIKKEADRKGAKTPETIKPIVERVVAEQGVSGTIVETALYRVFGIEPETQPETGGAGIEIKEVTSKT